MYSSRSFSFLICVVIFSVVVWIKISLKIPVHRLWVTGDGGEGSLHTASLEGKSRGWQQLFPPEPLKHFVFGSSKE